MTPDEMLAHLHEHGEDAGSDYNGEDCWFGWTVKDGVLAVTYECDSGVVEASWQLTLIEETT
jgi:hypothetical protein